MHPFYEEPIIASLLATVVNEGKISSIYCMEALKQVKEYNRVQIVCNLLPHCIDLSEGGIDRIKMSLKRWEKIVLKRNFEYVQSTKLEVQNEVE